MDTARLGDAQDLPQKMWKADACPSRKSSLQLQELDDRNFCSHGSGSNARTGVHRRVPCNTGGMTTGEQLSHSNFKTSQMRK